MRGAAASRRTLGAASRRVLHAASRPVHYAVSRRALIAALALITLGAGLLPRPSFAACEGVAPEERLQNTPKQDLGRDFDTILKDGWIEFALYEDFKPWSYEVAGKPAGIDVEIGTLIAQSLGVTARFRMVQSSETLVEDLRNYVWKGAVVGGHVSDVMLHAPYDVAFACTVDQVVFTGQYASERLAIAYKPADYPEKGPTPSFFRFDPVGVENDSISDFYLSGVARGVAADKVHRFKTTLKAMDGLASGEVMAVMGPRAEIEAGLTPDITVHEPGLLGLAKSKWILGAAISMQHRPLAYAVDDAIAAALEDGRIAAIFAANGVDFMPPVR